MSLNLNGKSKRFRQPSIEDFFSTPKHKKLNSSQSREKVIEVKSDANSMDACSMEEMMEENIEVEVPAINIDHHESPLLSPLRNNQGSIAMHKNQINNDTDGVNYEDFLKQYEDNQAKQDSPTGYKMFNKPTNKKKLTIRNRSDNFSITSAVLDMISPVENATTISEPMLERDSPHSSLELFSIYDNEKSHTTEEEKSKKEPLKDWGGVEKSLLQIYSECSSSLPELMTTESQFVLFDEDDLIPELLRAKSTNYIDKWDSDHVRLPCSKNSLYPVERNGRKQLIKRWDLISSSLYSGIKDTRALEEAILKYNSRFSGNFKNLHMLVLDVLDQSEVNKFFETTLPKMIDLAISLPTLVHMPIPMLTSQTQKTLFLTQRQVACLLANAFFCTFPRRNAMGKSSEYYLYPSINFNRIFEKSKWGRTKAHLEKLRTILHYFDRVTELMPSGVVSFERRVIDEFPHWYCSPCAMTKLHVSKSGLIEDQDGFLQVDFANKKVGGGVLGDGLVQEEIRFLISPELIISRLFTEELDNNECLIVKGAERFSSYGGYAETYKWEGDFIDLTACDRWQRKNTEVLIMDATRYNKSNEQYRPGNLRRELNKAFCGFYCNDDPDHASAIATGNWGCGAFQGDPMLKCLIQMMAAAAVGRDLFYLTFNDRKLMTDISEMYTFVKDKDWTIAELWNLILKYNEDVGNSAKDDLNIYNFLLSVGSNYDSSTDCD